MMRRTLDCLTILLLILGASPASAQEGCVECHGDAEDNQKLVDPGHDLVVGLEPLAESIHADLSCTDCHTQLADADPAEEHDPNLGPPSCDSCHAEAAEVYGGSVHGTAFAGGDKRVARCADCHGAHDIKPVNDRKSRVYKLNLAFTCAKCHKNPELGQQLGIEGAKAAVQYMESIHGRGLVIDGLIVSASCTDCHGSHGIYPQGDKRSPIHHSNVPKTCGTCHVGIIEVYEKSIHGQLLAAGHPEGPVCNDCHTSHEIIPPTRGIFKLESDERCGACHQERLARYRETYHGKAIALGQEKVAACYDCHGAHDIQPASNRKSHLSPQNKLGTCRECHPQAGPKFTGYLAHADHTDKEGYPGLYWAYVAMTALLLGVFGFFGLHTILWFLRSMALMLRDPKAFREARQKVREGEKMYVRFRPVDRFCHFLVIVSFLLLVLTGMPLKFYYTGWAQWMFGWMGGPEVAAALHRLGAAITLIYFTVHLVSLVGPLRRFWPRFRDESGKLRIRRLLRFIFGADSPVPNWQDFRDFWAHQKWFFGRGPRPQFDRWTYWEKFDYLAVFWGVAIIGLSGLVMWFPETVTRWLPGWSINLAHIIHSDEALLATGFIFTFHFFNVHFRVEKFPMDSVIFSGRISEEEMLHERKRLYDRLAAEGRLEGERVRDEWPRWKRIFNPIGMIAFTIGVLLIVLIYWAMASRLLYG